MPVGDIVPEIAVLTAAVAAILLACFTPHAKQWICAPVSLAGLLLATSLCLLQLGTEKN
ncbi:hypothetical protein QW131_30255 [Roseibium salinum]|nr:hypothetical protein [Roseibium salinum]